MCKSQGMKITRFGHAAVLLELADVRMLLDPGSFSPDDAFALEDLDVIAVTHQHPDHVDQDRVVGLVERNPDAQLLAEPQVGDQLRCGGSDWRDITPEAEVRVRGVSITGVGGEHATIHPDLPPIGNVGMLVTAVGEAVFFHPGDSYACAPAGVDVLAVPLSAPWAKVGETVDFVRAVKPRVVLPIHDRTIADVAYSMYWGRVAEMGGTADARMLGQADSTVVDA